MDLSQISVIVTLVAMLTSALVFPFALRFSIKHDIVDQPNARKLQRSPVPVFDPGWRSRASILLQESDAVMDTVLHRGDDGDRHCG